MDKKRDELKQLYPSGSDFVNNYVVPDSLLNELFAFAEKDSGFLKDITVPKEDTSVKEITIIRLDDKEYRTTKARDLKRSSAILAISLKATLARNLYDTNTFWQVNNELNLPLKKAREIIQNDRYFDILFAQQPSQKSKKKLSEKERKEQERWRYVEQ
ncbi:MAG: hypothetical protein RMJ53_03905 [Chitinophagales bacterium]|nr:hypothetical protein [Chitinophagales bacterium]